MFQELGPDARDLLGVVAFFPQGVDENNLEWLFPTISDGAKIFDKFCILSLTYRNNGFVMMLAPLRDHLCPTDPMSSPLLCMAKEGYFSRLLVWVDPNKPGFKETRWITSEDMNVEHLLNVFTTIDASSDDIWGACADFMAYLYWHKPRLVMLRPKIEGLPDDHRYKPQCLLQLSRLFQLVGNHVERKRLLIQALELWRERRDEFQAAVTLRLLSDVNRALGHHTEGIRQAEEALKIYEQLGHTAGQGQSLQHLAWLLYQDNQLDAAEEAASRAIDLLHDQGDQFLVCTCYRLLGFICRCKGKTEKAMDHLEAALGIASPSNWHTQQFLILCSLTELFSDQGMFDDAHAHVERAKPCAANDAYLLGRAVRLQASFLYQQRRFGGAKSEALRVVEAFERLGAAKDVEDTRQLLRRIEEKMNELITPDEFDDDGELVE